MLKKYFQNGTVLFIILLIKHCIKTKNAICKINEYYKYDPEIAIMHQFSKFDELILKDCETTYTPSPVLEFVPNQQIIIDSQFDLNSIISHNYSQALKSIIMTYFSGIDINTKDFKVGYIIFMYVFSKLNLYNNNTLVNPSECNEQTFRSKKSFFSNFYYVSFTYVNYPESLCPYIFKDAYLYKVFMYDITNSYINKNRLSFMDLNETDEHVSFVYKLDLGIKYETLTRNILSKHVFKDLFEIKLIGVLIDIEADLFKNFKLLKNVDFRIDNFKEFFHRGNKWMFYLNSDVYFDLDADKLYHEGKYSSYLTIRFEYKKLQSLINRIYEYPNEDFCLFHHFPHNNLVLPMLVPGKQIECSCTILWLIQYYYIYLRDYVNKTSTYQDAYYYNELQVTPANDTILYCYDTLFQSKFDECNFKKRLNLCNSTQSSASIDLQDYEWSLKLDKDLDLLFLIKWAQFVLNILLQPILCLLCIVNNALAIICIKNKSKAKLFKEKMYKYIIINSAFNIAYCLCMQFKIINECLFHTSTVYCSRLYQLKAAQYFKLVVVFFMGNVLKYCMNFSFLFFTFSRYVLILNKTTGFYKWFNSINLKWYTMALIAVSSLLSLFKLFQYQIVDDYDPMFNFPNEVYSEFRCSQHFTFYCGLFSFFKILNSLINDIIIFLVIFIIDVCMLKNYGSYLKQHSKLVGNGLKSNEAQNEKETKKRKKRITRMVLINSLIHVFFYFPGFVAALLLIVFSKQVNMFEDYNFSSNLINEEAETLNLVSIALQFYIFVYFNNSFYLSFKDLVFKIFS